MKGIVKTFGPVKALKGVNLDLRTGEVHALMGENGAGKSTLMKVLTGIHEANEGQIFYNGQEVKFQRPKEAMDAGIVIVHQELNMMNHLTVAQNIFIGREKIRSKFLLDDNESVKRSKALFDLLKLDINPTEKVGNLTVGKQQMVEIAKALSMDAKVIVFDEPTAALTETEINELFAIIDDLRSKGVGIVYISHRMDEIARITDRVTVMRDGEYVGTVNTKETTKDDIIAMMVGRTIYEDPKAASTVAPDAPVVLKVQGLNSGSAVKDVSFELRKGEILGFSGLMGAGRTEVARCLFGADAKDSGTIEINGKVVNIQSPQDAIKCGIGYLSEDRKRYGCIVDMTIANNTVMTNLDKYTRSGLIDDQKIITNSDEYVKKLKTKTPSSKQLVRNLSGGNQQKVVIAKWLEQDSDILIFDEPTRGIDVGAKSEIYRLMNDLVAQGKSIIMISSELTEILRMSDRIVVMCEGRKTGELDISEATQERILALATQR
ncbi:MAG: sugar ABC transporter ATP-binding protein [Aerococcaceae bacterium]|nr:sugar ABC transporter ATP-binding protein [Aerococcaceae bacterium]